MKAIIAMAKNRIIGKNGGLPVAKYQRRFQMV
jgi:hypothetical protein